MHIVFQVKQGRHWYISEQLGLNLPGTWSSKDSFPSSRQAGSTHSEPEVSHAHGSLVGVS